MSVVISPNIKREAVRLNANGDVIDPRTKQIIKKNEPDYKPTKEEIEAQINAPKQEDHVSTPSPLAEAIKKQVQEAIASSIKDVNIKEMVDQAIKDAFK